MENTVIIIKDFLGEVNKLILAINKELRENEIDELYNTIKIKPQMTYENSIYEICYCYLDLKTIPLNYICFYPEIKIIGPYEVFGINREHNLYYVIDSVIKEVHLLDNYDGSIKYRVAKDTDSLIKAFTPVIKMQRLLHERASVDNLSLMSEAILRAGGETFSPFFRQIFNPKPRF